MSLILEPQFWVSLLTLTSLEIILGIDNLLFLAIISNRLPLHQQAKARKLGLILACVMRLLLLASIFWLIRFTVPLFSIYGIDFSVRSFILIGGGLFLIVKAVSEMHAALDPSKDAAEQAKKKLSFASALIQIMLLDIVFSLDSVITAVGLVQHMSVMAIAIIISVIAMLAASEPLSRLVNHNPTIKMLALSFLLLVGTVLVAEGLEFHVPRGYLYFSMGFALLVEILNSLARRRRSAKRSVQE